MSGRWRLIAALLLCAGCRNRPTQLDPFIGRTTVPPPSTGSIGPQSGLVLPAAPPTIITPAMTSPPTTPGATPYAPPGGFTPNTSPPRVLSSTGSPASPPTQFVSNSGGNSTPIRVVPPDPNARPPGTPTYTGRPGMYNSATGRGVDIMDLPTTGGSQQPKTAGVTHGAVQTYNSPSKVGPPTNPLPNVDKAVAKTVTLPGQQASYAFDPSYTQLSGKLEYSSLDGRWLLRYVSPDNRPDQLGGVAVLVTDGPMAGFRNGDFVTAQGRMKADGSASPVFSASSIAPQRGTR